MACIAGGIAQAYYEDIPEEIIEEVRKELSDELLDIIDDFCSTYNLG
jgi:ADP-ribosylglycohydrolase